MDHALEGVEAGPVGKVPLGCEACSKDQVSGFGETAVFGTHEPFVGLLIELCINDLGVEGYVFTDVEDFVDVLKVPPQFGPGGEPLTPVPIFPDFFYRVFVNL